MFLKKAVPVIKCTNMEESLRFYIDILDFNHIGTWPASGSPAFSILRKDNVEITLSTHSGDGIVGNVVFVIVKDVDALFQKFLARGLNTSNKLQSPVHQGPVDQTWGWREFYVTDPSGNTLRFGEEIQ
jgi:uncharacterized glyoxalase superfamily protein PhnB